MRIALLANDDLTSNVIFAPIFDIENVEVVAVFFASSPSPSHSHPLLGALELFHRMSTRYWIYLVLTNGLFKLFDMLTLLFRLSPSNHYLSSIRRLARINEVPYRVISDFSSTAFIQRISELELDLLLIRIGTVLSEELLNCPAHGTWCVHSSILPACKGIAGEFHALRLGNIPLGTTIFSVTQKLDDGTAVAAAEIERSADDSVFAHMLHNNTAGAKLLRETIEKKTDGGFIQPPLRNTLKASYYSWPSRIHMIEAQKKRLRLISLKEAAALFALALRLISKK